MNLTTYAREGHDNNFHLFRHLAAVAVVLTHSYAATTGLYESEPLVSWFGRSIGHYAVDVFFVLSGFVVTQSLMRDGDLLRFTVSRSLRIFPALFAAIFATVFLLGPFVSALDTIAYLSHQQIWTYIAGAGSTLAINQTLPGVFANATEAGVINASLWTLKYEIAAYAVLAGLAVVGFLGGRRMLVVAAGLMVCLYFAGHFALPWLETSSSISNLQHLIFKFFLGASAFVARRYIPLTPVIVVPLLGLTALTYGTALHEIIEGFLVAYTLLWLAFIPSKLGGSLERFGDISYGIYIFAFPIQQSILLIIPGVHPLVLFVLALSATIPVALLSWHLVENPSLGARHAVIAFFRNFGARWLRSADVG